MTGPSCPCGRRSRWLVPDTNDPTGAGALVAVCGLYPHPDGSAVPPVSSTDEAAGPLRPEDLHALALLLAAEASYTGPDGPGSFAWATSSQTVLHGVNLWQQVAVHWSTVRRLLDAGLVDVDLVEDRWDSVHLTSRGRAEARGTGPQSAHRVGAWARQRRLERIRKRDGRRCQAPTVDGLCGAEAYYVDHVVPVIAGGTTTPDNLVTVCTDCLVRRREDRQP